MALESQDDLEPRIDALIDALKQSRDGTRPSQLQLGAVLTELDSWLNDDRQWSHGGPAHWKTLVSDLRGRVSAVAALSEGDAQSQLEDANARLGDIKGKLDTTDEASRRQLRRASQAIHAAATNPETLVAAWRRIVDWAGSRPPEQLATAFGAIRDLADIRGHDGKALLADVRSVLADSGLLIARIRGESPTYPPEPANALPAERLAMAEGLLSAPVPTSADVVWLEYLQATLWSPKVLELGSAVTLYQHDFLRSMIHEAPEDERLPPELRGQNSDGLTIWLDAYDGEKARQADFTVPGDPRVYLRLEMPEMPRAEVVAAARETADFLVAFASLAFDNNATWIRSESFHVNGWMSSTHTFSFDERAAEEALGDDLTAGRIHRQADMLGRHLPLTEPELLTASRLLVWLRQATATDNPARLVLCERVIEQVCGWAGRGTPTAFVRDALKPHWTYSQLRRTIERAYIDFHLEIRGSHPLKDAIETPAQSVAHERAVRLPSIDLKQVLEHLDDLATAAPVGSAANAALKSVAAKLVSKQTVGAWLDELSEDFDSRNARLRRTRNALMHGGPIVRETVDHASQFAEMLAHTALGAAIDMLLKDEDVTDGFLDRQQQQGACLADLRRGVLPQEALFWSA